MYSYNYIYMYIYVHVHVAIHCSFPLACLISLLMNFLQWQGKTIAYRTRDHWRKSLYKIDRARHS